jgi:4-hydroxy-2-oxoheptanedioate aldolase
VTAAAKGTLAARLAGQERLLGTFSLISATEVVELIALAGFDLVIVDMEHGPHELGQVHHAIVAAAAHGLATVVRVREPEPALIGAVLDLGASGVLVPQITSAADAGRAVRAARFAPNGGRGANPWVRAGGFGQRKNWFAEADREIAVLVMVEGATALADLPGILAVPGLTGIFLGPVDLSHALGVPGELDHPSVVAALQRAVEQAGAHGMAVGVFSAEATAAARWWASGVRLVAVGVDTGLIGTAFTDTVRTARTHR